MMEIKECAHNLLQQISFQKLFGIIIWMIKMLIIYKAAFVIFPLSSQENNKKESETYGNSGGKWDNSTKGQAFIIHVKIFENMPSQLTLQQIIIVQNFNRTKSVPQYD